MSRVLKQGYIPQTVQATLQNGQLTILNFVLVPANAFGYSGTVRETGTNNPIAGAKVSIRSQNGLYDLQATSDNNGNFSFATFYTDNYEIIAGHWGQRNPPNTGANYRHSATRLIFCSTRAIKMSLF